MKHFYFGYGMNTDPQQMALRTGVPFAMGRASLDGYRFRFATHADVVPHSDHIAHGVLWQLNDEQLGQLDQREGYPYYYDRSLLPVVCDGVTYQAEVYRMTPGHSLRSPDDGYLRMLRRGYTHFGVPQDQIDNALRDAEAEEEYALRESGGGMFDSWMDAITHSHGRETIHKIRREAFDREMSAEDLCRDYVAWNRLVVPLNIRVRGDHL